MLEENVPCRRLLWMLVLTALFNTVDYFATQDLVVFGQQKEWNPLMRPIVGTAYFTVYKLVIIPLGLLFLWFVRGRIVPRYLGLVRLLCGTYALLMVYTWVFFYT